MKIMIATIKPWNIAYAEELRKKYGDKHAIKIIGSKEGLDYAVAQRFQPEYIFFPHWSYTIPANIYENYNCVVFHMTDLPYGRGGSPLQNLVVRGKKDTVISAIQVSKEIDAGAVYMKVPLSLEGDAGQILKRASGIIFEQMIPRFFGEKLQAIPQVGEIVSFERRKPEDSRLPLDIPIERIYDYIRMLDAEGYPHAFISYGRYHLEFTQAKYDGEKISAHVIIWEDKE